MKKIGKNKNLTQIMNSTKKQLTNLTNSKIQSLTELKNIFQKLTKERHFLHDSSRNKLTEIEFQNVFKFK
jgi:hypothetical protein